MQTTNIKKRPARGIALLALGMVALPLWVAGDAHAQMKVTIAQIQGAGHVSPYAGQEVTTTGIVTAVGFRSYYVQSPVADGNDDTSEGMFVFTRGATPDIGDLVELTGTVTENIPGGSATGNLSITQMSEPSFTVMSSGNALPDQ